MNEGPFRTPGETTPGSISRGDAIRALETFLAYLDPDKMRGDLRGKTAERMLAAYEEFTQGTREDPTDHLKMVEHIGSTGCSPVLIRGIEYVTLCEHHGLPFLGVADIAYYPGEKVAGLSKIPRMIRGYAARFQLQERLGHEIAWALMSIGRQTLEVNGTRRSYGGSTGAMVRLRATHTCLSLRGAKAPDAVMETWHGVGDCEDGPRRDEAMRLLR